jgi:hypothetical protein
MSSGFFDIVPNDDVTLHDLEKWTSYLYENLGWITLAYENNREDKVQSYLISIKKLKLSIESRLKIITNEDSKIDLTTLLGKTKHLNKIATKLFDKRYVRKTICDKCSLPINNKNEELTENSSNLEILSDSSTYINYGGSKKKSSKIPSKKSSKIPSKKSSKIPSKKSSKIPSKKSLKVSLKKISNFPRDKILIKKLSKKSSKKTSKIPSGNIKRLIEKDLLIKKLSKISSKKLPNNSSKKNLQIFKKK